MNAERREYQRRYREENRERLLAQKRVYYQKNRKRILARIDSKRSEKLAYDRRYHRRNRDRDRERRRAYQLVYRGLAENKLAHNLRNRVSRFIRKKAGRASTEELLGCSFPEFKRFLERQFRSGMAWSNYGDHWHVDHIVPVAAFDLSDPDQLRRCFHFSNLRPLRARENLRKSKRITYPQLPLGL